jgi:hypothetical protein
VTTQAETAVTAAYSDRAAAETAAAALIAVGLTPDAITIAEPAPGGEGRYLWRLVVVIVLWSILGGVAGAFIGLALYATIGPEGTAGLVFQVVCWTLIGHLIFGMVAGYWVLADRTQREMPPDRVATIVTVRVERERARQVQDLLQASGARDAAGRPRPSR